MARPGRSTRSIFAIRTAISSKSATGSIADERHPAHRPAILWRGRRDVRGAARFAQPRRRWTGWAFVIFVTSSLALLGWGFLQPDSAGIGWQNIHRKRVGEGKRGALRVG